LKAYKEDEGKPPLIHILDTDKIRVPNSFGSYIRMVLGSTLNGTAVRMKLSQVKSFICATNAHPKYSIKNF